MPSLPLNCNCKGQRPHKGTENTMKIAITAIHIKEHCSKENSKPNFFHNASKETYVILEIILLEHTSNYFSGLNQRDEFRGAQLPKCCSGEDKRIHTNMNLSN